jgi:hypothetical protein
VEHYSGKGGSDESSIALWEAAPLSIDAAQRGGFVAPVVSLFPFCDDLIERAIGRFYCGPSAS